MSDLQTLGSFPSQAITFRSALGDRSLEESWSRIFVPEAIKGRLLNHTLLALELRMKGVSSIGLPLHGLLIVSGPPGVGKSTLARGLGSEAAQHLDGRFGALRVAEVNLHVLTSELLGRTQRNIVQVFEEELPDVGRDRPVIVVLDELEVLAVSRARASLEMNPADVFRGTAALLSSLDWIAEHLPKAIVVATTNLPEALDEAILSRTDLRLEIPPPSPSALRAIIADALSELESHYPGMPRLSRDAGLSDIATLLAGADGRQARKFVVDVLARDAGTASNPACLTLADMLAFARERAAETL